MQNYTVETYTLFRNNGFEKGISVMLGEDVVTDFPYGAGWTEAERYKQATALVNALNAQQRAMKEE